MPLDINVKSEIIKKIQHYEGRFNHLYLDTKGKVTVGVGHLIPNRNAIAAITLHRRNGAIASLAEKQAEYDKISKLPYGQRYGASSFKPHCSLVMKDAEIDSQVKRHIDNFYTELTSIYSKSNGYLDNFDTLPRNAQIALFDMIFNLGAQKLVSTFPNFNKAIQARDWKKAATESNRTDISPTRNQYVKQLFNTIP